MARHWPLTVAVAQCNPSVGNCLTNTLSLAKMCHQAKENGADLIVTPLMALCGHPVGELADFIGFQEQAHDALTQFAYLVPKEIPVMLGHACLIGGKFVECIYLVHQEEATPIVYRIPSSSPMIPIKAANVTINNTRISVFFADMLPTDPDEVTADILLVCDASGYEPKAFSNRVAKMGALAKLADRSVVYANLIGGQDEWIFDGRSFVLDNQGDTKMQLPAFTQGLAYVSLVNRQIVSTKPSLPIILPSSKWPVAECYDAIRFSLAEFVRKNGFNQVLIGLSGGLDSALVLAIAVDALGHDSVTAIMMPSPYTSEESIKDARDIAHLMDVTYHEIPIQPTYATALRSLDPLITDLAIGFTEENIQARTRGMLLMTLSNQLGALVLATSNKSEVAVGYSTLYGDTVGGFAPLKDVYKTQVYEMAAYRNTLSYVIPETIIHKAPSAELRHNQTDQDSLPNYDVLDAILDLYLEKRLSVDDIAALGYDRMIIEKVSSLVLRNEFKRRQAPIGPRLSRSYFTNKLPVTHHFVDENNT